MTSKFYNYDFKGFIGIFAFSKRFLDNAIPKRLPLIR